MSEAKGAAKTYEFYAGMTCGGCKGAITRILTKIDGVSKVDADVDSKKVLVQATVSKETLLEALEKWGKASKKEVRFVKE